MSGGRFWPPHILHLPRARSRGRPRPTPRRRDHPARVVAREKAKNARLAGLRANLQLDHVRRERVVDVALAVSARESLGSPQSCSLTVLAALISFRNRVARIR